jgi:hypothetical protein
MTALCRKLEPLHRFQLVRLDPLARMKHPPKLMLNIRVTAQGTL